MYYNILCTYTYAYLFEFIMKNIFRMLATECSVTILVPSNSRTLYVLKPDPRTFSFFRFKYHFNIENVVVLQYRANRILPFLYLNTLRHKS